MKIRGCHCKGACLTTGLEPAKLPSEIIAIRGGIAAGLPPPFLRWQVSNNMLGRNDRADLMHAIL